MLLIVYDSVSGVDLSKSGILLRFVEPEVFAAHLVGKGSILGYYYRSFVYLDFSSDVSWFKPYSNSIMKVTRETLLE